MAEVISYPDTVTVWGKPYEIRVTQFSKAVWWATGDYRGEALEVKDRTGSAAARAWTSAATYRGR